VPHMQPTRVMTLGNLGSSYGYGGNYGPRMGAIYAYPNRNNAVPSMRGLGAIYMQPTGRQPNILKQTMMSGLGRTGRFMMGLGDLIEDPNQSDAPGEAVIAAGQASGALSREVGQSVANPNMAMAANDSWMSQTLDLPGTYLDNTWVAKKGSLAALGTVSMISALVSAYHGYRRDRGSIGSAVGWFVLGAAFPIITPAVAFMAKPGFAKPRGGKRK